MEAELVTGGDDTTTTKMQIFVVLPRPGSPTNPNTISLEISSGDTVASLKARLQDIDVGDRRHIPPSRQRLVFAGATLPDDNVTITTLTDLGVGDSSTVQLVETRMWVRVYDGWSGSRAIGDLSSADTVDTLKARYEAAEGVPADRQRLTLTSIRGDLENGRTLADYGVGDGCTVYHHRLRWRHTDAFGALGRVLKVKVCGTDTVGLVKRTVKAAVGVPVAAQRAYRHNCSYKLEDFDDLEEGRTMEELGIMVRHGCAMWTPVLHIVCRQQQQAGVADEEEEAAAAAEGHPRPYLLVKGDLREYDKSQAKMFLSRAKAQAARNEKPYLKPPVRMMNCILHVILEVPDPLLP